MRSRPVTQRGCGDGGRTSQDSQALISVHPAGLSSTQPPAPPPIPPAQQTHWASAATSRGRGGRAVTGRARLPDARLGQMVEAETAFDGVLGAPALPAPSWHQAASLPPPPTPGPAPAPTPTPPPSQGELPGRGRSTCPPPPHLRAQGSPRARAREGSLRGQRPHLTPPGAPMSGSPFPSWEPVAAPGHSLHQGRWKHRGHTGTFWESEGGGTPKSTGAFL